MSENEKGRLEIHLEAGPTNLVEGVLRKLDTLLDTWTQNESRMLKLDGLEPLRREAEELELKLRVRKAKEELGLPEVDSEATAKARAEITRLSLQADREEQEARIVRARKSRQGGGNSHNKTPAVQQPVLKNG